MGKKVEFNDTGSLHWLFTRYGHIKRIGEFMSNRPASEELWHNWGQSLYKAASELIDNAPKSIYVIQERNRCSYKTVAFSFTEFEAQQYCEKLGSKYKYIKIPII